MTNFAKQLQAITGWLAHLSSPEIGGTSRVARLPKTQTENPRSAAQPAAPGTTPDAAPEVSNSPLGGPERPPGKPLYLRWWAWGLLGGGAVVVGTAVTGIQTIAAIRDSLPATGETLTFVRDGTLTIKASDGNILQQTGPATRDKLAYEEIPPRLAQAFVAAEDQNFYEHGGVDYKAIGRAIYTNLRARDVVEGASTITQQLARIVFLDQSRTAERKIREALLAQEIEANLSKQQILESYLNLVYLGGGAYGVADAAWNYFSKPAAELTLSEMATIAGLAPAPSVYSPLVDMDAAQQRRDLTLRRMVDAEFITAQEMQAVVNTPLEINPSPPKNLYSPSPYFTTYIKQELPKFIPQDKLAEGGLTVETTLNVAWQKKAEEVVDSAIANYGGRENFGQAALVAIEPDTGAIRAMVGGGTIDEEGKFNRVTQAQRQPGSTFKAIVYAAAVAAGFSPYKSYEDEKIKIDGKYEPTNYGDRYRGSVSMRDALTSSLNIVAIKTLIDVGFDPVVTLAQKMGIGSNLVPAYSLALGTSEVNLLEMTGSFSTLAAEGLYTPPHGITRVLDRNNEVIYEAKFEPQRALDQDSANITTWMLRNVVNSGTGRRARLDRPVAGKTGTTENKRDLWFIGYIPQLTAGIWLGNDDDTPTRGVSGTAAQVWRNFMDAVDEDIPFEDFPERPSLNGRTATIERQPVKPKSLISLGNGESEESYSGSSRRSSSSRRDSDSSRREPEPRRDLEPRRDSSSEGRAGSASSAPPRQSSTRSPAVQPRLEERTDLQPRNAPAPAPSPAPAPPASTAPAPAPVPAPPAPVPAPAPPPPPVPQAAPVTPQPAPTPLRPTPAPTEGSE
ncbi:MAG: PBP1A family penicillin-binding protein [Cyanobacteria bacterium P01_A01_bin.135]